MKKSSSATHALKAVFAIRDKILSGQYSPGDRLGEVAIAEELNISRTPVRDALSHLAGEGMLERASTGGFIIREFGYDDVVDSIELRGILEGTVARLAAERGASKVRLNKLDKIVLSIDECFDIEKIKVNRTLYAERNAEFHEEFGKLSGSQVMERELSRVMQMPFASPSAFLSNKKESHAYFLELCRAQQQHRDILLAIANGQGTRAEAIARAHANMAMVSLGETLAINPLKLSSQNSKAK